jgi:hypothetical protein
MKKPQWETEPETIITAARTKCFVAKAVVTEAHRTQTPTLQVEPGEYMRFGLTADGARALLVGQLYGYEGVELYGLKQDFMDEMDAQKTIARNLDAMVEEHFED